jgi:hypothetical protein
LFVFWLYPHFWKDNNNMPKFMYIFRGGGYADGGASTASPTELQEHLGRWRTWTEGLMKEGRVSGSHPLTHPVTGKTVRGRDKVITDGPYAETKDLVSGALIIEAASLEEASELARGCPILEHDSGSVEVRPVLVHPG